MISDESNQYEIPFFEYERQDQRRLQYIRENLSQKTNRELAEELEMTFGKFRWLQRTNNLTRDERQYNSLRKEMGKRQAGENNPNWRGGISKDHMRYKRIQEERYPEHVKARKEAQKALRNGTIIKKPCEVCSDENTEMHHEDYSKPLDVIFLCIKHHKIADKYLKEGIKLSELKEKLISINKKAV